ncbi:MAG: threonine ammonia-lyase [Acidimicrobiales bacterium]
MIALVGIAEIRSARRVVGPVLRPTATEISDNLSRLCGRRLLLKAEHLQRTGSFKIRGAYNAIAPHRGTRREIVAASAGNHAQGVALAASLCELPSTIFMPTTASLPKVEATRAYGGTVRFEGHVLDETLAAAHAYATDHGASFIPPFDDPLVIAGQGTCGLEIAAQAPGAEVVVVPIGGGGLISGIAAALRAVRPAAKVIGVEAAGAASMVASLKAGSPVTLPVVQTMADGIALKAPGPLTLAHVDALVDDVVTVTEEEIGNALVLLLERAKAVVEPAGAVSVAALLAGKIPGTGTAVAVLSGGNVDSLLLSHLIERGLSAAGRYLRFRVVAPDQPGSLAAVTRAVADLGLNVLDVEHIRASVALGMNEVEIVFTVETRNPDHRDEAIAAVAALGFDVERLP